MNEEADLATSLWTCLHVVLRSEYIFCDSFCIIYTLLLGKAACVTSVPDNDELYKDCLLTFHDKGSKSFTFLSLFLSFFLPVFLSFFFFFENIEIKITHHSRIPFPFGMISSIWNVTLPSNHFWYQIVWKCAKTIFFFSVEFNTCEILRQGRRRLKGFLDCKHKAEDFVWMEPMGKKEQK